MRNFDEFDEKVGNYVDFLKVHHYNVLKYHDRGAKSISNSPKDIRQEERERGLCRGSVSLPEDCGAGSQEKILRTVIRKDGVLSWIIPRNLYDTMGEPMVSFFEER